MYAARRHVFMIRRITSIRRRMPVWEREPTVSPAFRVGTDMTKT